VELGQESIVALLLRSGKVDYNTVNDHEWSPTCLAVLLGNKPFLKMLLNWEAFYSDRSVAPQGTHNGVTPLHLVAAIGNISIVETILASGRGNFGLPDLRRNTPLHCAASGNFKHMVEGLTAIDPNLRHNHAGIPPYIIAIPQHFEVVQMLAHDPNFALCLNWHNDKGNTALHLAALSGHHKVVGLLTAIPTVDPNLQNDDGCTALHLAARYGHNRVVELLANFLRVDLNPIDHAGRTPLIVAIEFRQHDTVKQLLYISTGDTVE
jgi:ankyrin repeat protein